jgi:hypothetical protein
MRANNYSPLFLATLLLAAIACRPVIAIGWGEFLVLVLVIAFLLGPLLLRFYRYLSRLEKIERTREKKDK